MDKIHQKPLKLGGQDCMKGASARGDTKTLPQTSRKQGLCVQDPTPFSLGRDEKNHVRRDSDINSIANGHPLIASGHHLTLYPRDTRHKTHQPGIRQGRELPPPPVWTGGESQKKEVGRTTCALVNLTDCLVGRKNQMQIANSRRKI